MIFMTLKAKLYAGAAIALGALLATVKVLLWRNSLLRERVEYAEAKVKVARVVAKKDIQISKQTESRRAELIDEIQKNGECSSFRDPNKLFTDSDN